MEGLIDETGRISDPYRNLIHVSRYARWNDSEGRRETWVETVDRYINFIVDHLKRNNGYEVPAEDKELVRSYILEHKALPSLRALMTAGPALERNNIAGYNCSYVVVDTPRAFDEILYILMNGTGVGFSAESRYVSKLPAVSEKFEKSSTVVHVDDSKEGWAKAYRELVALLYSGQIPSWDTSKVRPAGAKLNTFGGRASGPAPLEELFDFTVDVFQKAAGRRLSSLEAHDLVCKIASVVVVGGVRRAALISLSDLDDSQMQHAKSGSWWVSDSQRRLANNSAVYESKPTAEQFLREWTSLIESKSGERGIFSRAATRKQVARNGRRNTDFEFGTNPCSEIILRPNQFCNLSTVVVSGDDTLADLERKVKVATILGTWQSTLTNFKYLRRVWTKNTEEERLLGVSMTGPFGNKLLNGSEGNLAENLEYLRQVAIDTNVKIASEIGIPQATAVTCIKPEGTSSQLTLTSSGLHPWHSEYYIRTVRADKKDPLTQFMVDVGFPHEDDVMAPNDTSVFAFPIAAPEGALTRNDLTAIEHLELWLTYQRHWCEHKPSVTIYVKEDEWVEVGAWVYRHFDELSGVSFLPHTEHVYKQAPYQDITVEDYERHLAEMPQNVNWEMLSAYEAEDTTTGTQELSCTANSCEVVDLVKEVSAV